MSENLEVKYDVADPFDYDDDGDGLIDALNEAIVKAEEFAPAEQIVQIECTVYAIQLLCQAMITTRKLPDKPVVVNAVFNDDSLGEFEFRIVSVNSARTHRETLVRVVELDVI
jgi:hypothetical protein